MSDEFTYQLSVKIGPHLVNVRAADISDFCQRLQELQSNADLVRAVCAVLPSGTESAPAAPEKEAPPQTPVAVPAPQATPQGARLNEYGPVPLSKCDVSSGTSKTNGKPYTRYICELAGKKFATMDKTLGAAAQGLVGRQVYYSTEMNGTYENLASIRQAQQ